MICASCGARGCRCAFVGEVCAPCAARQSGTPADSVPLDLRLELQPALHFWLSATGIGDAVCGVYAGAALADALAAQGRGVVFHTSQAHWLERVSHPNLTIRAWDAQSEALHQSNPDNFPDLNAGYETSLTQRCRKTWYLGHLPQGESLLPRAPQNIDRAVGKTRTNLKNSIVLSPYSAWRVREWPATHWSYLAHLLCEQGWSVAVLGGETDGARLQNDFGACPPQVQWYYGQSAEFVTDLLLGARAFIGNDSGMTHLAALLGVPTLAVHAQLAPGLLWNATEVVPLVPQTPCRFCAWQVARGWRPGCGQGCAALATISPHEVAARVASLIGEPA